jgi:hypothetical protein
MALARCRTCGKPAGRKQDYVAAAVPFGYLNTAAVCGSAGCEEPALIWLTGAEKAAFESGVRIFGLATHTMKVRVSALELN